MGTPATVLRLDVGVEPFLLASTLQLVVGQRLVRRICVRLFLGKGCSQGHGTGFRGRLGIFELFEVDDRIRAMIMERQDGAARPPPATRARGDA